MENKVSDTDQIHVVLTHIGTVQVRSVFTKQTVLRNYSSLKLSEC